MNGAGRFAPSPTSDLHLGNLRTALLAWLFARSSRRAFRHRIEDLDAARVSAARGIAERQQADLAAIGLDFDGEVLRQSERLAAYREVLSQLDTYECYCTRREISEAASAPHGDGYRPYPGTCLQLSATRRSELAARRSPALRVRAAGASSTVIDLFAGEVSGRVDDFVVERNDGVAAYNFAVVVDDLASGIDQVIRGDDLLPSAPRQAWLAAQLGAAAPQYAHVPLAVNPAGRRLAKRDGAVSLTELKSIGISPQQALNRMAASLGMAEPGESITPAVLLDRFEPKQLPRQPWVVEPGQLW